PTSSPTADLKASFLVVTAGKPCCRSKRRDAPGSDSVRMPVRFSCHEPWSRMDWISERYCFMSVRAGGPAGGAAASGGRRGLRVDDIDREAQLRGFIEHGRGRAVFLVRQLHGAFDRGARQVLAGDGEGEMDAREHFGIG